MTVTEAAALLQVTQRRVQALITAGRLKAKRIGKMYWIQPRALEAVRVRKNGRPSKKDKLVRTA